MNVDYNFLSQLVELCAIIHNYCKKHDCTLCPYDDNLCKYNSSHGDKPETWDIADLQRRLKKLGG